MNGTNSNIVRKVIFIPMSIIFVVIIMMGIVSPTAFYNFESAISNFQYNWFGWLYSMMAMINIAILAWLAFSKHGDIILGGEDAKPILSRWNWFAIALCGGIGTGIVFWGIAEPIFHLNSGIPGTGFAPGSNEMALEGLSVCMLHWGIPSYAHYCIFGVAVGFAIYNMKLPYRISSTLYPLFGKKSFTTIGNIVDNICLFAIAVSVSAILAVAALNFGAGFYAIFGIEPTNTVRGIVLVVVVSTFIISSYTGLQRGIRRLSDMNAKIFIGLLFFIFVVGQTRFSMFFTVEALGRSLDQFFPRMTYLSAIEGNLWPMWWTVIYWIWMIVYGPMVGLFLGKIAKGRSIREFIIMNLMVPASFAILWFGIFGANAIKLELDTGGQIWNVIQTQGLEASVFSFLDNFPLPMVTKIGFMITLFLSVVTLCDSMTSTVASLSIDVPHGAEVEPPNNIKIFWGLVMSSVAFLSILASTSSTEGAVDIMQSTKLLPMTSALPVLFIYVALAVSMLKMFTQREKYDAAYYPETCVIESELMGEIAIAGEEQEK
ncbi:Choline-glycine betaine transporter [Dethiosulfatibacter aminovorans DSM 17477]|uniref:Choline-glycine betaine transporter n=1 Tax=Dethiosulfatibacter aminovorans DSM 17477 TaxID=1121476 RepID=A0A1M6AAM3_9FIRM|nr:BCCT family transporter [Dethiosulfatibacter aminovorans]SHI33521.1 Choline-glycine betaine transporter [Dethiosulfatibacter aminovorans DSM 17477]